MYRTFSHTHLYLTFFCLFIDLERQTLAGAGCGHPPPLLYSRERGTITRLDSENTVIGLFEHLSSACAMQDIPFRQGDRVVLYTDGITEAVDADGTMLDVDGLEKTLRDVVHLPPNESFDALMQRLRAYSNGLAPDDDRLLLSISYAG